jgi:hypothetical protein
MTRATPPAESLPAAFFKDFYKQDPDPWGFAKLEYERNKYAATLAARPAARYRCALRSAARSAC